MTTSSKGAIDIDTVWLDVERINRLIQQHGGMFEIFLHSYSDKSCKRSVSGS